jgi:hypothetical protein
MRKRNCVAKPGKENHIRNWSRISSSGIRQAARIRAGIATAMTGVKVKGNRKAETTGKLRQQERDQGTETGNGKRE